MNVPRVAVIIPTYNESAAIANTLEALTREVPSGQFVVVDDSSPDGTGQIVARLARKNPAVHLITRSGKQGRGAAVLAGFHWVLAHTESEYCIEMDADGSHQVSDIAAVVAASTQNTVVLASRHVPQGRIIGWPLHRHVFSACATALIRVVLQLPVQDATNGFRAYPRSAVAVLVAHPFISKSYFVLSESVLVLMRAGFSILEVPSTFIDRKVGKSNTDAREIVHNLEELVKVWLWKIQQ